jgi:hypothetical protein
MASTLPFGKIVLWTSSVGLAWLLARRLLAPKQRTIDVGAVSDTWLAQQRWPPSDPFTT